MWEVDVRKKVVRVEIDLSGSLVTLISEKPAEIVKDVKLTEDQMKEIRELLEKMLEGK